MPLADSHLPPETIARQTDRINIRHPIIPSSLVRLNSRTAAIDSGRGGRGATSSLSRLRLSRLVSFLHLPLALVNSNRRPLFE